MNILILGANGFIGSHICEAILAKTNDVIYALDIAQDKLENVLISDRFHFQLGDMRKETAWISEQIKRCDVVLPLAAIATPAVYVNDPIRVFELDFEANLSIIRLCVNLNKRIIFPSTSEVYGMSLDSEFDEESSHLVTGPIHKERWIYSSSKQLLDRLIYAYGKHQGLVYSLFRPFNWYGPRLDNIFNAKRGGSRVISQFIGNIIRGEDIHLVNGGSQKRCFTYIDDGIEALLRIIENKASKANKRIFNIGNPVENISIRELAETLIQLITSFYPAYAEKAQQTQLIEIEEAAYFGEGYQDIALRVPSIRQAETYLQWQPKIDLINGLKKTLAYYLSVQSTLSSTTVS